VARRTLNLGILAHVDAGKTTLTERLLYAAGVIDELGSVDKGTTQTDSLALERQRGITIKSAVVSFAIDGVTVNLIDTPGHPDFIAEVERVLSVLDGAVLVVSAVEGVQPQTRILMRALLRLRVPTLVFVNKIDRAGAGEEQVLHAISERLTPAIVPLGSVRNPGTRAAGFEPAGAGDAGFVATLASALAEHDDGLLAAFVDERSMPYTKLRAALVAQTEQALVHPVFFGSALTGAGVDSLRSGIAELLPAAEGDDDGPVSGTVFKIERGASGEKIAYVRMFSGTVRTRDRLRFGDELEGKVTAIRVFDRGLDEQRAGVSAGEIGKLWGLAEIRIGDRVGEVRAAATRQQFAPPTLEAVVVPRDPDDKGALRVALSQLAEQDPLIDVRQDDARQEISVSLYGEVQKEVIQATLADDFGLEVGFRETTTICVERPAATGEAIEILQDDANPFSATVGLRVEPAVPGSGVDLRLDVDHRFIPLHIFKTAESFGEAMTQYVRETLLEGRFGWQVTDCAVTLTDCGYYASDGMGKPSGGTTRTVAADFRKLTPMVLMQALERAGTVVCEPVLRARLELPAAAIGSALAVLARLGGVAQAPSLEGELATIDALLPAAWAPDLQRELPALTAGEGVLETAFGGYQPVSGAPPTRRRRTANPLNREEYLLSLGRRPLRAAPPP
jgi:ribosomal protection tetracycline resistance protein